LQNKKGWKSAKKMIFVNFLGSDNKGIKRKNAPPKSLGGAAFIKIAKQVLSGLS